MSKILVMGDGLLGSEIVKQTRWHYISRHKDAIDFLDMSTYVGHIKNCDTIVNCIANTNTYSTDRQSLWDTNYKSVVDLADYCQAFGKKLVQISTDYVYANTGALPTEQDVPITPKNWYTYTKLLSDAHVQMRSDKNLVVRCSFKPRPFPYPVAINQVGNFDYVDTIAGLIVKLIKKGAEGLYNVGTASKSMFDLARQTNPDVEYDFSNGNMPPSCPTYIAMNVDKMNKFLGIS